MFARPNLSCYAVCARAHLLALMVTNDAKTMRSRDAQCDTEESPFN